MANKNATATATVGQKDAAATAVVTKEPTAAQKAREAREANLKALRDLIPAGSRIFTSIKHVAPSGKTTSVNPFSVGADLDVVYLDNTRIAEAIGFTPDGKNGGIRVQGTAADPGAVLVSALASALYGKPDALSHRPV